MSRVIGRSVSPSLNQPEQNSRTLLFQSGLDSCHCFELFLELGEPEIPVFGGAHFRGRAAHLAPRLDQLLRLEPAAAGLALVAARAGAVTVRALPLDVAVGQKAPAGRAVVLLNLLLPDVAFFDQSFRKMSCEIR